MSNKRKPPRPNPRTLGPVSDLERHLPDRWWQTLFNSVYLRTDGDVVENDAGTAREVDLLLSCIGLEPSDRILDLCCGQGRHSLELARRGFTNVVGVDRSRYLVRLAKRRAAAAQLPVSFHEGDARRFRLKRYDFQLVAILGNSFGYFDSEEGDSAVMSAVARALVPGGSVVLDLTDGDWMREHFEPRSWEWIDQEHLVCRERSLSGDGQRLISREVVVHAERGVIVDQFYAERLYSHSAIAELLERAGFRNVRLHEVVEGDSTRNQDLGMMARRALFSGQSPPKVAGVARSTKPVDVTVVLGDPRLPDDCKLGGKFNAEDLDTVARMKAALGELSGYTFSYLDNHASLMNDLRQQPPSLVFNLCDEGYNNDAFRELHVPAILEMLDIPYTGAGPSALGLCYNKDLVRAIAGSLSIAVPLESYMDPDDQSATLPSVLPALVKPAFGDSSVGITVDSVVHTATELVERLHVMHRQFPGRALLVQELLTGPEYTVGVLGNPGQGYHVLPILEVDYSALPEELPAILGYESKWDPQSPYWTSISYRAARLPEEVARPLHDASCHLFERLGCRDYARFDFRADAEGTVKLLEVNPNPGWCWDGKFNLMAQEAGLTYPDLLRLILEAAQARIGMSTRGHRSHDAGRATRT